MSLLPDPDTLRAIAGRIDRQADAARARAGELQSDVSGLRWRGPAASAFDALAGSLIGSLRESARDLDRAAQALRDHAAAVEQFLLDLRRAGVDVVHARDDIVALLRDGADPLSLVTHPGALLHDGVSMLHDGAHLAHDGLALGGDAVDDLAGGVQHGVSALKSLVGI